MNFRLNSIFHALNVDNWNELFEYFRNKEVIKRINVKSIIFFVVYYLILNAYLTIIDFLNFKIF